MRIGDKCPICKSEDIEGRFDLYDDRYAYPGIFPLKRCRNCGHGFLEGEFTPEMLRDLYSNYYPRSELDLESFRPLTKPTGIRGWLSGEYRAFAAVPENVRVLDIGCGFGESLAYHTDRGCEVYGVEADDNIKKVAAKFGFNVHVGVFEPSIYESDFFDYITMDQVIEHVIDPIETFRDIARILKPGGKLVMTTPNANGWGARKYGNKWINWHTPYHIHHFSRRSMRDALEAGGMRLRKIKTLTSSAWHLYQEIHNATFPPAGTTSAFWKPGPGRELTEKESEGINRAHRRHGKGINHALTRFYDFIGRGDNFFILTEKPA